MIKKKSIISLLLLSLFMTVLFGCERAKRTIDRPAISMEPDQSTRLLPSKAQLNGGINIYMPDDPYKSFWVEKWNHPSQSIQWNVKAESGSYLAEVLIKLNNIGGEENVILELSDGHKSCQCIVTGSDWQRCVFENPIQLLAGTSTVTLRILSPGKSPDFNVHLFSLELTELKLYAQLKQHANELRSDAHWIGDLKYGFFFHWNSSSMPRFGDPKTYEEAVNDFDTEGFAKMVYECGGGLVFFTTAWAEMYFPGPLRAIDNILPGRTTSRDLVSDMANALGKYGIKLILYYNVLADTHWRTLQSYSDNPQTLYTNLENILGEISDRYGSKIAGIWLDDGMGYYPGGANFEKLTRAAKRNNKDFLICYNSWIFPRLTDFQDYYAGELGLSDESAGMNNLYLPVDGSGVFIGGPQEGLQATYCGLLESGDWTHRYKDSEIDDPLLTIDQLVNVVKESDKRKNLPMINVRIYQDGTISPKSEALLKELKKVISD